MNRIKKAGAMKYRCWAALLIFSLFLPVLTTAGTIAEPYIEVAVSKGDCLIAVCERYLEDPRKWRKIAKINGLTNPHVIYPGQTLILPVALLRGEPTEGTVRFLRGKAEVREKEGEGWRTLLLNDRIREGNTVRTGKDSAIEIQSESGDSWNQRSDTILAVTSARKKGEFFFINSFLRQVKRSRIFKRPQAGIPGSK